MRHLKAFFSRVKWAVLGLFGVKPKRKEQLVASIEQPEGGIYPLW